MVEGELQTLMAELLLDRPRDLDGDAFEAAVQARLPGTRLVQADDTVVALEHGDFTHQLPDGRRIPIVTAVLTPVEGRKAPEMDLSQSWSFPEAADVVRQTVSQRLVTEMLGAPAGAQERVRCFHAALSAAIEQLQPIGVWCPEPQLLLRPGDVLQYELAPVLNVRCYAVEDDPGVLVMDTVGLHQLQLPDLQCHFRGLPPADVATVLCVVAAEMFDSGQIPKNGARLAGLEDGQHWVCRQEKSLLAPERLVIDLDPGEEFAAGRD